MIIMLKVLATGAVALLLTYPWWAPQWGAGILGEIAALGMPGAVIAVAMFFAVVALYCSSLQRTLRMVRIEARVARPGSVWWMFAIPYNFVEDFFILSNVGRSMGADGRLARRLVTLWTTLGLSWAALQIVSLLPGVVGLAGGGLALLFWAAHWILNAHVNRVLRAS